MNKSAEAKGSDSPHVDSRGREELFVHWNEVIPFKGQPRTYFNQKALKGLATNIAAVGQLQAALVRELPSPGPNGEKYELIDGQRRWHAVQIAKIDTFLVAVVRTKTQLQQFIIAVASNFGRAEHTAMEVARACHRLRSQGLSLQEIAAIIGGKSITYVSQRISLVNLIPRLQVKLEQASEDSDADDEGPVGKRLTVAAALQLAKLVPERQWEHYTLLMEGGGTLDVARALVERTRQDPQSRAPGTSVRERRPSDDYQLLLAFMQMISKRASTLAATDFRSAFERRRPEDAERVVKLITTTIGDLTSIQNGIQRR